ncbi:MAG: FGGY-family carbohydrate kinase [Corynebacterium sp.]|uniref:rhamnulokinase n=1 Tax=Corynebacterium sp. TaxID=1720 RepID=UPI0026DCB40B|nr:FGGY-family carbohydrate kinase [Corynebacterium sp.]MDO4762093.1 FGGY-family carbohydrate kinase [Corynebacterium sp.]
MCSFHIVVDLGSSSGRVLVMDAAGGSTDEVHRFAHTAQEKNAQLVWDIDTLITEVVRGLGKANEFIGHQPATVGIDTWGVDYALLDEAGDRIGEVVCYRDERTTRTSAQADQALEQKKHFSLTGIQPDPITTARQLFAQGVEEGFDGAAALLLLPDYVAYELTGEKGWSQAIVSTSALAAPGAGDWAWEVFDALNIPRHLVGEISPERSVVGPITYEGLNNLTVVRSGSHDTACAVHGLRLESTEAFISCGSWSLFGCVNSTPVLSDEAFSRGVTNEVCTDGKVRLLHNLTGLWIMQQCCRNFADSQRESDIATLAAKAATLDSPGVLIDTTDPIFTTPGDYASLIASKLEEHGYPTPDSPEAIVRVVTESLATTHAHALKNLEEVTGRTFTRLRMIGGGVRNTLLCQLTADYCQIPVVAGPQEGTAFGSALAQIETISDTPQNSTALGYSTVTYLPNTT